MKQKVVLVVMDGVGIGKTIEGDAVRAANTPTLDDLMSHHPWIALRAHGTAVGLPSDDDMGNSEVGHNALGCGQIYAQGAKLVNESIQSRKIFESETWHTAIGNVRTKQSRLHFLGLLSDGNVHSNIAHLKALVEEAKKEGVREVRLHALLDGRDVPPTSGLSYIQDMEAFFASLNDDAFHACFASGGGRMKVTMDRYRADWGMVERGWLAHVLGEGAFFPNAAEAYTTLRRTTGDIDQDLPSFVIAENGEPVGRMEDGDSVIFFNFRGDRAIEISMAFDDAAFPFFDRKRRPDVFYCGMLEYDGDLHVPKHYLVNPPMIENTLTEFLVAHGKNEFACSETQKFGHVTYFWNGNRSEKFSDELETWLEIPSDNVPFDQRPWMKSAEVTDALIEAMRSNRYDFLRINYPNGDMVGHTGVFDSVRIGVESVDLGLKRLLPVARELGYTVLVTADHGNSDDMLQKDPATGQMIPKTAHSLNPVPFILFDPEGRAQLNQNMSGKAGLANIAATVVELLGFEKPDIWEPSLLQK
ncbi:MAG: 2,3-bisphosphoglycerate-independent phosphoglycerate mutase [Ndongobacter sp.]|nr:2,3-bisphosphoglycerate-independent phosphoglycerate mutase [Ndongobacter sp.]